MTENNHISSINVMLGLTLLLIIFTGDLVTPVMPSWLGFSASDFDGMGLADWVFPGFLFMVGMIVPSSIGKKISQREDTFTIAKHIIGKSVSLIIIGVLILNSDRVNPEFTGIGKNLWTIFVYIGIFLVWFKYTENDKNFFTIAGLRLAGVAILIALVFKFRSGEIENGGSLITGSWGMVGIIGWGYLISAFIYLSIRDSILNTVVALLFFLSFNILSGLGLLNTLNVIKPIFGVVLEGSVPLIMISGMLTALILKKYASADYRRSIMIIVSLGLINIIAGFILRRWFIISSSQATPSWGLICCGISMLLFAIIYWIADIKKLTTWTRFVKTVGEYPLTAYLAVNFLYSLILSTGISILFYKQSGVSLIVLAGSVIWTFMMAGMTILLVKYNIKLKLIGNSD